MWETCTFSDEIVTGQLDLHKFAVELHDVIAGKADPVYQDPHRFLRSTYLTSQMRGIVKNVLNRIEHRQGIPCIIIDTGFGGGKTHTLMLLYHILSNPKIGFDYIKRYKLDKELEIGHISNVRTVAIDCRDTKKETLWGEIAYRLGKYDTVEAYDNPPRPIHNLDIIKGFFDEPTLLMIDELPHYLSETLAVKIGGTTKSRLTEDFLYKLISAASSSRNSVFVLTLTENQQLYKDRVDSIKSTLTDYVIDGSMEDLRDALSRQTSIVNPVSKEEIYDVLRHRLVKNRNAGEQQAAIQEYMKYYTDEGLIVDPKFQERLEKSYPIHPDFIGMLYDRVSTISKFNQTRGTLRFLALVLNDIYERRKECTLVSTGDINLESPRIVDEITAKIGRNEFAKIISSDCIEHAKDLDRDKPVKVIEEISRTIYLYSLHETPKRKSGITADQIVRLVGRPGFDTAIMKNSLYDSIRTQFWYIQETNDQFYFVDAVNENAIIAEYARRVSIPEVEEAIHRTLIGLVGSPFKPVIWRDDVEDSQSLRLCVLKYDDASNTRTRISRILENVNEKPRNYPNTIVFAYADPEWVDSLKTAARELAAIHKAKKDERIKVDRNFLKNINKKKIQADGNLSDMCTKAYCRIGYPDGPNPRLDTIPYGEMTGQTIGELVREFLIKKGKLVPAISHHAIQVNTYRKVEEIYNEFLADKRKKFVENVNSIKDAVLDGVLEGAFGYGGQLDESAQKHRGAISEEVDVKRSGYIIHKDYLVAGTTAPPPGESGGQPPVEPGTTTPARSFVYRIPIRTLDEARASIESLLVGDFGDTEKRLQIEFGIAGNTSISLSSSLDDLNAVSNVIRGLKPHHKGGCSGALELCSNSDIGGMLKENDLVYE